MKSDLPTHDDLLATAESGCLVIADVIGYTRYLNSSELEHANDVLADLIETVVAHITPSLKLAKLEGDAVFAYGLDPDIEGYMLMDLLEETYFAFRSRRRSVNQATVCDCNACRLIPDLDLKFVVHHGRFVRGVVAGGEELTGSDVIVVHRLLKNTITSSMGVNAYIAVTEACATAFGLDPAALGMHRHLEALDGVGETPIFVMDLEARWQEREAQQHLYVGPEEAEFEVVERFAAAPPKLWEAYTSPRLRLKWQTDFKRIDQDNPLGRPGPGTVNHCVHGKGVIVEEILDWRPFEYFTTRISVPMIGPWEMTVEVRELENEETELRLRARRIQGRRRLLWALMKRPFLASLTASHRNLRELLERKGRTSPAVDSD